MVFFFLREIIAHTNKRERNSNTKFISLLKIKISWFIDQRNFLTWHIVLYTIVGEYDNITHPAQENIFNINIIKLLFFIFF